MNPTNKPAKTGNFSHLLPACFGGKPNNQSKKQNKIILSYSNAILERFIPYDHELKTAKYMQETINFNNSMEFYYFSNYLAPEKINEFCVKKGLQDWNFTWDGKSVLQKAIYFRNDILFNYIVSQHTYLKNIGEMSPIFTAMKSLEYELPIEATEKIYLFIKILVNLGSDINRGGTSLNTLLDCAVILEIAPLIDLFVFSGGCFYQTQDSVRLEEKVKALEMSVSRLYEQIRLLYLGSHNQNSILSRLPKDICHIIMREKIRVEIFTSIWEMPIIEAVPEGA